MSKDNVRDWLMQPGNNFCALPFTHMAIEANGDIRPCCMGDEFDLNIRNKTIQQVYNDPKRLQFVDSFRRNEQHPACHRCWKDPEIRANFSTSPHAREITKQAMNGITPKHELKWLEIKPGNRCNLKCRICGVHNSSSWTKDAAMLDEPDKKYKDSTPYKYTQSCDWIDDPEFWNDLNQLESIEYLHFMGGEPFMVPEHFQLIKALIDNPTIDTSKITIGYNTNGTYFPSKENFELYKNFKRVNFAISIDDVDERFNYQRKLADWEEVKNNIKNFEKLNKDQYFAHLDPTISIYNIFYLDEITKAFNDLGYHAFIRQRHFVNSGYNAIHILPERIKNVITEKYKDTNNIWIKRAVEYMNSQPSDNALWEKFKNNTNKLDSLRKENFQNTFKEFYEHF
jgi:radical SAM protein with 4Fe4S-binding SPASM domain